MRNQGFAGAFQVYCYLTLRNTFAARASLQILFALFFSAKKKFLDEIFPRNKKIFLSQFLDKIGMATCSWKAVKQAKITPKR